MKNFAYMLVLGAVLALLAFPQKSAWCAEADLKDVVSTLEQGYRELNDVQADFTQRTSLASIKKEQNGSGTLAIKKTAGASAMFRFDYSKPEQQIVCNGKSVWFYIPENNQVMVSDVRSLFQGENSVALNYLTGMDHISRDYSSSFVGGGRDKKGNYVLELVPRKKNRVMAKLQITVAEHAVEQFMKDGKAHDPFPIVSSVVYDPYGNRTAIEFSRVRVNKGIAGSRFSFRIPKGVEVIKR
ncbi:MAG TPA: outer membrane lipoprotein carrier protein LolA [Geobacteraceae bacterium]|nr:outer membrane lipoprotein carrier protein LolA [Geobacteraceae bacterium]